ncbi:MAG: hypothetical protein HQK53_02735 [Oligoflexia bacterium]|nr:hypothetical protein [Oligoflexia bacterium]
MVNSISRNYNQKQKHRCISVNYLKLLIFSLCFILISCSQNMKLDTADNRLVLSNVHFGIGNVRENRWELGITTKAKVTRDITVSINYIPISGSAIETINQKYPIDSFLVRVRKYVPGSGTSILGHTLFHFERQAYQNFLLFYLYNKIVVRISYDGAYPTFKNALFPCSRSGHNKSIAGTDVLKNTAPAIDKIVLFSAYGGAFDEGQFSKSGGMILPEFNTGISMVGEYYFDIAFYSTKDKTLYSDFIEAETKVVVSDEEILSYTGCENYDFPIDNSTNMYNLFKIYD